MKSMKIRIISISNKCPVWISQGIDHFLTKFPQNIRPELIEIRSIKKNRDASKCLMEEKQKIMDRDPSHPMQFFTRISMMVTIFPYLSTRSCFDENTKY